MIAKFRHRPGERRDTYAIKNWMRELGVMVKDIAETAGVHHSNVSKVIYRESNNRKVLAAFVKLGCPVEYLDLPKKAA